MSSRSNGVTYCVFSSVIRSRVISSPAVSVDFTSAWVTARVGVVAEAGLRLPGSLERVRSGTGEEVVELGGAGDEAQAHGALFTRCSRATVAASSGQRVEQRGLEVRDQVLRLAHQPAVVEAATA